MQPSHKVISFYCYTPLEDPDMLREDLLTQCQQQDILGRILIGKEGINGSVSGETKNIKIFQDHLRTHFKNLSFREQSCDMTAYHKLVVRVRDEIVSFEREVSLKNTGKHLTPTTFKTWLEEKKNNKRDFVVVDTRNTYETDVGKFRDAITLPIETFREFPKAVDTLKHLQDKKVVLYCTGGVRCEKASAFLHEQGFQDVYQLGGGIINYMNTFPGEDFEGSCFVFDDRLTTSTGSAPISNCLHCQEPCDKYYNCCNMECDKLFISCDTCAKTMHHTCSSQCKEAPHQRQQQHGAFPLDP